MLVFVYGSLMQDMHNAYLLDDSERIGTASTCDAYLLYDMGSFPATVRAPEGQGECLLGELYEVDAQTLAHLDRLEGHPTFYRRRIREVISENGTRVEAWIYELQSTPRGQPIGNSWRAHYAK